VEDMIDDNIHFGKEVGEAVEFGEDLEPYFGNFVVEKIFE